jgi:hypothetical protein
MAIISADVEHGSCPRALVPTIGQALVGLAVGFTINLLLWYLRLRFVRAFDDIICETSEREINAAERAREILNEFLTNRLSLLQDPTVWRRLNLPESL